MGKNELLATIAQLGRTLQGHGLWLATAESCTGGLIAASITDVAGSSAWFRGAVVAYANEVKEQVLDVPEAYIAAQGAVSEPVVKAMVQGVCAHLLADCSVAVSGVAGPGGGTPEKPVGTVWIGWKVLDHVWAKCFHFAGDRTAVREATVCAAIDGLVQGLENAYADQTTVCGPGTTR